MLMNLTILELDALLAKVTQGDQTPLTFALAEKIRDAQDQEMARGSLARRDAISNAVRAG